MLEVSEKEEGVVVIRLPIGALKNPLCVGACTEIRTKYLPAH